MTAPRPRFIVSTADVPETTGKYPDSDEELTHYRSIGKAAGLERIGLHVERLEPGHRSSWPHAEEKDEEFVFVLAGEVDAWIDGELFPMKAGDLAAFPSRTGICHVMLNNSDEPALLLIGGERSREDNRVYYPHHPHRKEQMKPGKWWDDWPARPLGPHDGTPNKRG
jgi:uncharacterized cupin superfamily protein